MKRTIAIITSIMMLLSFTVPAELVFAGEKTETTQTQEQTTNSTGTSEGEGVWYAPDEVVVVFENKKEFKKAEETVETALEKTEGEDVAEETDTDTISKSEKAVLVQSDEDIDEAALCDELESMEGVAYAQPNYYYTFDEALDETDETEAEDEEAEDSADTADKDADKNVAGSADENDETTVNEATLEESEQAELNETVYQWNLDYVDAQEAWNLIDEIRKNSNWNKSEHPRVKVAVVDTGAVLSQPEFADYGSGGNIDTANSSTWNSYGGHGTKVTSLIAAANNGYGITGVAAGNNNDIVQVMSIDVYSDNSNPSIHKARTSDVIAGLDAAINRGAQVIQLCMGHERNAKDYKGNKMDDTALEAKINDAVYNHGIIVTASAGNKNDTKEWLPSDFGAVISVINTNSGNAKAASSSYGSAKDISAPGDGVPVIVDSGEVGSGGGTSSAAPLVAGIAAMVKYVDPTLSVDQVKNVLYSTTTDIYSSGYDIYSGWGIVNAYKAVKKAADSTFLKYDQEVATEEYYKSAADCTHGETYYKSAATGESSKGTSKEATFEVGSALGHSTEHYESASGYMVNGESYDKCTRCGAVFNYVFKEGYSTSYVKSFKVRKGKKKFTARWKKQSKKNRKKFSGYQVRYSTDPSMNGAAYKNVSKNKSSVTIKGKRKTRYYVQMRSVTNGYYSGWSKLKSVKTK